MYAQAKTEHKTWGPASRFYNAVYENYLTDKEYVPYIMPQEHGNHCGTRYAGFENGLSFKADTFELKDLENGDVFVFDTGDINCITFGSENDAVYTYAPALTVTVADQTDELKSYLDSFIIPDVIESGRNLPVPEGYEYSYELLTESEGLSIA